jgi:hypothetical protein
VLEDNGVHRCDGIFWVMGIIGDFRKEDKE